MIQDSAVLTDCSKGLLLLFLAMLYNFMADTMYCGVQAIMKKNLVIRYFAVLILIYFTINLTSNSASSPIKIMGSAIIVFFIYLVFMRQTNICFLLALLALFCIYFLSQYRNYYQQKGENVQGLSSSILAIEMIFLGILIVGFFLYANKQKQDHPKDFTWFNFVLGANYPCASVATK